MIPDAALPSFRIVTSISIGVELTVSTTYKFFGRSNPRIGWLDENILYCDSSLGFEYRMDTSVADRSTPEFFDEN